MSPDPLDDWAYANRTAWPLGSQPPYPNYLPMPLVCYNVVCMHGGNRMHTLKRRVTEPPPHIGVIFLLALFPLFPIPQIFGQYCPFQFTSF